MITSVPQSAPILRVNGSPSTFTGFMSRPWLACASRESGALQEGVSSEDADDSGLASNGPPCGEASIPGMPRSAPGRG